MLCACGTHVCKLAPPRRRREGHKPIVFLNSQPRLPHVLRQPPPPRQSRQPPTRNSLTQTVTSASCRLARFLPCLHCCIVAHRRVSPNLLVLPTQFPPCCALLEHTFGGFPLFPKGGEDMKSVSIKMRKHAQRRGGKNTSCPTDNRHRLASKWTITGCRLHATSAVLPCRANTMGGKLVHTACFVLSNYVVLMFRLVRLWIRPCLLSASFFSCVRLLSLLVYLAPARVSAARRYPVSFDTARGHTHTTKGE